MDTKHVKIKYLTIYKIRNCPFESNCKLASLGAQSFSFSLRFKEAKNYKVLLCAIIRALFFNIVQVLKHFSDNVSHTSSENIQKKLSV